MKFQLSLDNLRATARTKRLIDRKLLSGIEKVLPAVYRSSSQAVLRLVKRKSRSPGYKAEIGIKFPHSRPIFALSRGPILSGTIVRLREQVEKQLEKIKNKKGR